MDTTNKKLCYAAGCHRPLPPRAKKYCSKRCYNRINMQKKRARKAGKEWSQEDDVLEIPSKKTNVQSRRGQVYNDIVESGLAADIHTEKITITEVAKVLGTTQGAVSMAYYANVEELKTKQEKDVR